MGSISSDSGGGGDSTTRIYYAPYVEAAHESFLATMQSNSRTALLNNPYEYFYEDTVNEDNALFEEAFFGAGYTIASFPSLYDMYGKFMAGLDIDALYDQMFEDTVNAPEINALVSAEAALLDADIEANVLPRFQTGMRDINAVMSSSFVTGKAMIEDTRVKALSKFSAELKYRVIPIAADRWKTHLEWNKNVVMNYAEIIKLYYSAKMDFKDFNYQLWAKHVLWPFTVLDYERAAIGALQGASKTTTEVAGTSKGSSAIAGALSGAASGALITPGSPVGPIVGGILGLASSLF